MAHYYVNRQAQANGDHEVHNKAACPPPRHFSRRFFKLPAGGGCSQSTFHSGERLLLLLEALPHTVVSKKRLGRTYPRIAAAK
jgi:hypothetical protein